MAVGVEGHGYGGVTEEFLDEFRVDAPAQEQGGAGVTEVVEAYVGQVGFSEEGFERTFDEVFGVD